jgi:hypothetical protein
MRCLFRCWRSSAGRMMGAAPNGIRLPSTGAKPAGAATLPTPLYLESRPRSSRRLGPPVFVDDFLIAQTTLTRHSSAATTRRRWC